ncbi:hypoxanthine phosphoribosyltransferase [bacterium]|nr:hypoxanthine phosphoribosyltransferase [bacterium]
MTLRRGASITDPVFETLLTPQEIEARVAALADRLAPELAGARWVAVVILLGATPFAADLMRALAMRGVDVGFDALWLESYRDARQSSGRVVVRADVSRSVSGAGVLLIDDVFDSGRTISFARSHMLAKGAAAVKSCVFARKPDAAVEGLDYWAYDAPARFLVGYGMDDSGRWRGLPYLGVVPD